MLEFLSELAYEIEDKIPAWLPAALILASLTISIIVIVKYTL